MDPDTALAEIVELAAAVLDDEDDFYPDNLGADGTQLAEKVQALNNWLSNGGFLPARWKGAH